MGTDTLSQQMQAAQQGDKKAYENLLLEVSSLVRGYCGRRLGATHQAVEDLVQEVLIAVHRARHTYQPGRPFRPWLFAITRHKLVDFYRRRQRTMAREVSDEFAIENAASPEPAATTGSNFSEGINEAMGRLSTKQRTIVELLKGEGRTVKETAGIMGMSESAVKVSAHRAYKVLKGILENEQAPN